MESKKTKLIERINRLVAVRGAGWRVVNMDEGRKVQTSTYKKKKFWGYNTQNGDCS